MVTGSISDDDVVSLDNGIVSGEKEEEDNPQEREESPPDDDTSTKQDNFDQAKERLQQFRLLCGKVVNNEKVQLLIVILIAVNAIMMGIGTFDFVTENEQVNYIFESIDQAFLITFTVELCLQFIYHGLGLFLDAWLVFDFVIIFVSFVFSDFQIIRAFRIFRALRLVTRVKVMKNLVLAVFSVMPRMAAISVLLFLVFYIFAVMMTQLFSDLEMAEEDYFGRLDKTFFTLFQIMTLDAWGDIARAVMDEHTWAWIPFLGFVTISGFIFFNLIIAVICEAISGLGDDVKSQIHGGAKDEAEDEIDTSPEYIRQQLESLEEHVDELQRSHEKALHALQYLSQQLKLKSDDQRAQK